MSSSIFAAVELAPRDPILGLNESFNADTRSTKVNLGVGVYFDDNGKIPLLAAVKAAEDARVKAALPRGYQPIEGAPAYNQAVQNLLLGQDSALIANGQVITAQALGGTGALKIGADYLKRLNPNAKVYISDPSWENHRALFESAGFVVENYPYYDAATRGVKFVNAPVSGNPGSVRSGNLIFAASGDSSAVETARPYFEAIGRAVHNVGQAQQAAVVKICTNAVLSVVLDGLAEVLVLAEKSGVKRADLLTFINDSAIGSPFTKYKTAALVGLDMSQTFAPDAQRKDLRLALSLAEETGTSMPIVRQTEAEVNRLVESGVGEGKDFAAMLLQVAADSSLTLGNEG